MRLAFFNEADDKALIAKCLERDQRAWSELVGRYTALVYNVARHIGLSDQDAEDITQLVFEALLVHMRNVGNIGKWLTVTAHNKSINLIFSRKNQVALAEAMSRTVEMRDVGERERIEVALNKLNATDRLVVVLMMRDYTDEEIAAETHTLLSGIRMLKSRARDKFKSAYKL